jgi:hypothetical protein
VEVGKDPFPLLKYEFTALGRSEPYQRILFVWKDEYQKFAKGQSITVYYDPKDPDVNGLESDDARGQGWFLLVVVIALLSLVWWLYSMATR